MKKILEKLYKHQTLTEAEAEETLLKVTSEKVSDSEIASFLTVFNMRNITLNEILGFRKAMLKQCLTIDLLAFNPMDVCGTGGDGKNTFNISTLTAFVLAGAGIPVAKHGNYGVSSVSGSSNVLEFLGISFTNKEDYLKEQLHRANICFLHAPLFHPAMKSVAPIRKQLGTKTFFNMLGPLTNPSQPNIQMVGLYNLELLRLYQYLFQENQTQFSIIHALDGYDEITLTNQVKINQPQGDFVYEPKDFSMKKIHPSEIFGGNDIKSASNIFLNILENKATEAQNNVVLANSAIGIQTYFPQLSLNEAIEKAKESLFEKKALASFNILKKLS